MNHLLLSGEEIIARAREIDERLLAEGYVRFGAYCGAGRRSMWARFSRNGQVVRAASNDDTNYKMLDAIEIKIGREGSDGYFCVGKHSASFAVIFDIVTMGMFVLEDAFGGQRRP